MGTHGEELATEYRGQPREEGVKPGGDHGTIPLAFVKRYVGKVFTQRPKNDFDAEAVFVGHGISAPEFGWDDYKGVGVKGKVPIYFHSCLGQSGLGQE